MRKFKLLFALMVVVSMYACDNTATTDGTDAVTPADTTHTHTDGESHEGHDH